MEIWLRQNKKSFRFAILPSEYELTSESDNTQVNINKLGEINLIGKRKLKTVSFSSIFPKQKYSFCQYSTFPTPKESVKTIEKNLNICLKSLINYIQMENCATIPMMGRFGKNCPKEKNKRMGGKML